VGDPAGSRAVEGPIVPRFAAADGPDFLGGRLVVGMGWQPDVPDPRDLTLRHDAIAQVLGQKKSALAAGKPGALPRAVDNRSYCSPMENQGRLGSCTANAVVGMMEYMMRRGEVREYVDLSRLFLYKVTRKLLGWTGDTGAYLRSSMQAVVTFGVPPEKHWPYEITRYDLEPDAFLYAYAASLESLICENL